MIIRLGRHLLEQPWPQSATLWPACKCYSGARGWVPWPVVLRPPRLAGGFRAGCPSCSDSRAEKYYSPSWFYFLLRRKTSETITMHSSIFQFNQVNIFKLAKHISTLVQFNFTSNSIQSSKIWQGLQTCIQTDKNKLSITIAVILLNHVCQISV